MSSQTSRYAPLDFEKVALAVDQSGVEAQPTHVIMRTDLCTYSVPGRDCWVILEWRAFLTEQQDVVAGVAGWCGSAFGVRVDYRRFTGDWPAAGACDHLALLVRDEL
jgi:hypothetical protein